MSILGVIILLAIPFAIYGLLSLMGVGKLYGICIAIAVTLAGLVVLAWNANAIVASAYEQHDRERGTGGPYDWGKHRPSPTGPNPPPPTPGK